MHTRNLQDWLDLMEQHKVFDDQEHRSYKYAHDFIEGLMKGNRLTSADINCINGLLGCIESYALDYFEEHGTRP